MLLPFWEVPDRTVNPWSQAVAHWHLNWSPLLQPRSPPPTAHMHTRCLTWQVPSRLLRERFFFLAKPIHHVAKSKVLCQTYLKCCRRCKKLKEAGSFCFKGIFLRQERNRNCLCVYLFVHIVVVFFNFLRKCTCARMRVFVC